MGHFIARLFKKSSLDDYISKDKKMERSLTSKDLILMGVGAVIGAGIFITPGEVAAQSAGPGIVISFILATLVCSTSAMCYAEFSSALPIAGSAYSYGSIIYGELMGWILGWALILEYMLAVASVASGFSAYLQSFLAGFKIKIPLALSGYFNPSHGTYINLFSILIVAIIAAILLIGAKSSTKINDIIVIIKLAIIILFLIVGCFYVKPANWTPFLPFGMKGVLSGASLVFFAYLGFDTVSSSAAEVKHPKKALPIGIIGTLIICTILYILVSIVLTGIVSYRKLNVADPVSFSLQLIGQGKMAGIISLGAMAGMFTMMLMMIYSSSRLIYSIGRDGLLPKFLGNINSKHRVPTNSIIIVTVIIAIMSGLVSLDKLVSLVNIGTLIAFTFISLGIIPLRKRVDIHDQHGFKVPFYPVLPIISAVLCLLLLSQISVDTWITALVWYAFGLVIYFTYGVPHSHLNKKN